MRTIILIFVFGVFISCKQQKKSISETPDSKEISENFDAFLERFRNDSLFQISRIDKPLTIVTVEDNIKQEKKMDISYVSFDEKGWNAKPLLNTEKVSRDTINVVLQVEDTGIYFEHIFVLRQDKWYLFKIKNSST